MGPDQATNSTWTSVGLLSLTGTLLAAYYVLTTKTNYIFKQTNFFPFTTTSSELNKPTRNDLQSDNTVCQLIFEPHGKYLNCTHS